MSNPNSNPSSLSTLPLSSTPPLSYDHSPQSISNLITHITTTTSITHTTTPATLTSKSHTPHSPSLPHQHPLAIFYPLTTADVSHIVRACHARNIVITAYAGGTSLGGALTNTRGGVCIDFRDMDRVIEVHEEDLDVVVQPGVGWVELNRYLEERGVWMPVDPAPGARVGGMIAMSCSGTHAYRHGTIKDWVLSLTLVLADGSIIKTRNRPRKSAAGYDLTHLVIGSEGTLALVTEAVLRVTPLPKNLHVGMFSFEELQAGVDVAVKVLRSGYVLEAIELVDRESMRAICESGLVGVVGVRPTLFVKFAGSRESVGEQIRFVREVCAAHGSSEGEVSDLKSRVEEIWGIRKCLANALVCMKKDPSDVFMHTDAAVPISKMAELVRRSEEIVRGAGRKEWFCASVGHVGDGNVHTAIVCPNDAKEDAEKLLEEIQRLSLELDGTITGEHGVGLKLRDMLAQEVGQAGVDAMRKIKFALDPKGILNPDKVIRLDSGI